MVIYGVSILAICYMVGQFIGELLGKVLGVDANVGGVGFAMVILIFATGYMKKKKMLPAESEKGIVFWSSMYIPIVVAMSAKQNVLAAVSSGLVAVLAGVLAVVVAFTLIPVITKLAGKNSKSESKANLSEGGI